MLKTTILFIGLLTEVSHLNPDLDSKQIKEVAQYMSQEVEFSGNNEIIEFINTELSNSNPAMLHCKKIAYNLGMRPEGVSNV